MLAADSSSRWQAYEYGLDLRDFHGGSSHHPIVPIVIPTGSAANTFEFSTAGTRHFSAVTVATK